jgi:hypothetical protein
VTAWLLKRGLLTMPVVNFGVVIREKGLSSIAEVEEDMFLA